MTKETQRNATVLRRETIALPSTRPTGLRCIQLFMPDDDQYLSGLAGILSLLGKWTSWQRSENQEGSAVADIWRNALQRGLLTCDGTPIPIIDDFEDDMNLCDFIRYDENGHLQIKCCGEWVNVPGSDNTVPNGGVQPPQQTRPEPQQDKCFHVKLDANGGWLLPIPVNSGDVITITNAKGGWNDGTTEWYCPNGSNYVAEDCSGDQHHDGGDPSGSAYHMELIFSLLDAPLFALSDSPFTVPSGHTGDFIAAGPNDGSPADNRGSIEFDVCIKNGTALPTATWCKVLDFTASNHGFSAYPEAWAPGGLAAAYSVGVGWHSVTDGTFSGLEIQSTGFSALEVTSVEVFYHVDTTMLGGIVTVNNNVTSYGSLDPSVGDHDTLITNDVTGVTKILAFISKTSGAPDTATIISKMIIHGKGTNPFGTSNC